MFNCLQHAAISAYRIHGLHVCCSVDGGQRADDGAHEPAGYKLTGGVYSGWLNNNRLQLVLGLDLRIGHIHIPWYSAVVVQLQGLDGRKEWGGQAPEQQQPQAPR